MSSPRSLVITGATGKQGGAVISALSASSSQPFKIYAVTRDKNSSKAQALAKNPNVSVLEGDFAKPDAIFKQVPKPWGLFSVTTFDKSVETEESQGKEMNRAAFDAGIKHIVFTATDRGAESETTATDVPHFVSKYNIEQDIKQRVAESSGRTTYTLLRPVAFMENLTKDFFGKGFVTMWQQNGKDRPLQLVATSDIGRVAAEAFLNADKDEYRNKAISLAGDSISPNEAARVFKQKTGQQIPSTFGFVGSGIKWASKDMGMMFNWLGNIGFGTNVPEVRKRYPFMKDFGTWLETESAWRKS